MDDQINELLDALFGPTVEIPIVNCPPELENAEVEYQDADLQLIGVVRNGKLIAESADEIPEGTVIVWGKGHWVISF
jgi:hypothetical protein